MTEQFDEADEMCPNCVTPWKCNGPHLPDQTLGAIRRRTEPQQVEDAPTTPASFAVSLWDWLQSSPTILDAVLAEGERRLIVERPEVPF